MDETNAKRDGSSDNVDESHVTGPHLPLHPTLPTGQALANGAVAKDGVPETHEPQCNVSPDISPGAPLPASSTTYPANVNPSLVAIVGAGSAQPYHLSDGDLAHPRFARPNPWKFLELYKRPYHEINDSAALQVRETFPLDRFPPEVLLIIAEQLPPESAACLSLINKATFNKLAERFLGVEGRDLWRLLYLLERDLTFYVVCDACKVLHHPFVRWEQDWTTCTELADDSMLPATITEPAVRAIVKACLQNRNYGEFLGRVDSYYRGLFENLQYIETATTRMVGGNLLLRTEVVLRPRRGDTLSVAALWTLSETLRAAKRIKGVCDHKSWALHRGKISIDSDRLADQHDMAHHRTGRNGTKSPTHQASCFSNRDVLEVLGEGGLKAALSTMMYSALFEGHIGIVGAIRGCEKCFTDYCVTHVDVDGGVGRCIVLTAWKDLGGVADGQAYKWDTHMGRAEASRLSSSVRGGGRGRGNRVGDVYRAWKGFDFNTGAGTGAGTDTLNPEDPLPLYVPHLDKRVVKDLKLAASRLHQDVLGFEPEEMDSSESEGDLSV